jgi:hypothetical protein
MKCQLVEERLIQYTDRSLPAEEMTQIVQHLHECSQCPQLLDDIGSLQAACQTFPVLDPDLELIERILLRTSGRPRTRSFGEIFMQYFLQPIMTPRFAVGASLAVLFLILAVNLMMPKATGLASALSPKEVFRQIDRVTHQVYSKGLKLYDKKNEIQAQFRFFRNNLFNQMDHQIEQLDVPVQSNDKPGEPGQQQDKKNPDKKSSLLLLPA